MEAQPAIRKFRFWPFRRRAKIFRMSKFEKGIALFLTLFSLFMFLPIIYIFNHALKPYHELFLFPPTIWAREPSFANFIELLFVTQGTAIPISRYIFNSVFVAILCVIAMTIISALCAYPLSKHKFPGSKALFALIMLCLLFAPETVQIPRYLVAANIGIMNNYAGHVIPLIAMPVGVFLMKQFIDQVPDELLESARMDGAREMTVFLRIVVPICMPAVATISMISFNEAWGNEETSVLYMQDEEMKTLPFYVSTLTSNMANNVARQGAAAAAAMLLFVPNLVVFLVFQSRVIATMAHSGIK